MSIFLYENYKEALKYVIRSQSANKRGVFRRLAEHLGVHATLVSQVISGNKDFTEEQLFSVCEHLGIGQLEKQYLWTLLQIERSGSSEIKKHYLELKSNYKKKSLKISNRSYSKKELSDLDSAIFYSHWIYSAVHLATTLNKSVDIQEICNRFSLEPKKAREILNFLIQANLVHEKDGCFKASTLSTHLHSDSPFLNKHHTNWRLKAIQSSESLTEEELMYTATFSVSKKDFVQLREILMETIKKFLQVVKESPSEELAQLNIDCFWLKPGGR